METPQGQTRLVDAIECSDSAEPNGNVHSKNTANIYLAVVNQGVECFL
jgi:hypothetical protein